MHRHRTIHSFSMLNQDYSRRRLGCWLGTLLVVVLMALGVSAEASMEIQGMEIQGMEIQGMEIQDTDLAHLYDSPVADSSLLGFIIPEGASNGEEDAPEPTIMAIHSFRGAVVEGAIWDSGTGAWQEAYFHPSELSGMHWFEPACDDDTCFAVLLRIASVAQDTASNTMLEHSDNSDIWLYEVEYATSLETEDHDWINACGSDGGDRVRGLFVDGQWNVDASWSPDGHTFSCPRGVVAKCARGWGYKPWKTLQSEDGQEVSLQLLHQACTRAARADYCGDGTAHTREGTLVDMFDVYGFNVREQDSGFLPEAGFDEDGATWMSRPRWAEDEGLTCESPLEESESAERQSLIHVWSNTDLL